MKPSFFEVRTRFSFWQGLGLGGAVLLVFLVAGETVQVSYHGALHATVGQAVLEHGLQAENPYHAGVPLRYYLLYPQVASALGGILGSPWWGFSCLAILAAFLFPLALHAFTAACGLSVRACRNAFWVALLGFNAWGWLGFLLSSAEFSLQGPPVFSLAPLSFSAWPWHWDMRLQAFFVKFLNVSSFAIALPFALWAGAGFLRILRSKEAPGWSWMRVALPAGIALAWNPLVGGVIGLAGFLLLPKFLFRHGWRSVFLSVFSAALVVLVLAPWLLPLLESAPLGGPTVAVNLGSQLGWDLFGPLGLLLLAAACAWQSLDSAARWGLGALILPALGLALWGDLPWGNEYKLVRWLGILCVPLAALFLTERGSRGLRWGLAAFALPSFILVLVAYLQWGQVAPDLPWTVRSGHLELRDEEQQSLVEAIQNSPDDAVLLVIPLPGGFKGTVQGHPWAPVCGRSLFVDALHVHNEGQADLHTRQNRAGAWFAAADPLQAVAALQALRSTLPQRSLVICGPVSAAQEEAAISSSSQLLMKTKTWGAWLFPALVNPKGDEN